MNNEALKSIYAYNMLFNNTSIGTNADGDKDGNVKLNTDLISDFDLQNFDPKRFEYYTTLLKTFDNDQDTLMKVLNKYNSIKNLRVKEKKLIRVINDYVNKINENKKENNPTVGGKKKITAKEKARIEKAMKKINDNSKKETDKTEDKNNIDLIKKVDEIEEKWNEIEREWNKKNEKSENTTNKFTKDLKDFKEAIQYFENNIKDLETIEYFEKKIDDFYKTLPVVGGGFVSDSGREKFIQEVTLEKNKSSILLPPAEIVLLSKDIIDIARKKAEKARESLEEDKEESVTKNYFKGRLLKSDDLKDTLENYLEKDKKSKEDDIEKYYKEQEAIYKKTEVLENYVKEYDFFAKYCLESAKSELDKIEEALSLLPTENFDNKDMIIIKKVRARKIEYLKSNTRDTYNNIIKAFDTVDADSPAEKVEELKKDLNTNKELSEIEKGGEVKINPIASYDEEYANKARPRLLQVLEITKNYIQYSNIPNIIKLQDVAKKIDDEIKKIEDDVKKIEDMLKKITELKKTIKEQDDVINNAKNIVNIESIKNITDILERKKILDDSYNQVEKAIDKSRKNLIDVESIKEEANDVINKASTSMNSANTNAKIIEDETIKEEAKKEARELEKKLKEKEEDDIKKKKEKRRELRKKRSDDAEEERLDNESKVKREEPISDDDTVSRQTLDENIKKERSRMNWGTVRTKLSRTASTADTIPPLVYDEQNVVGGAKKEEIYSDDTLKAQYLDKQRYRSIDPVVRDEFRGVNDEKKGKLVRIKTENKIDQLSNDIETYNALSIQDREANKDDIIKKIKDFENDPHNPLEELEITLDDRIVFIIATFFIRYVTILMVQWCIDINIIKSFYEGFIYYAIIYIILFWFVVLFINIDNSYDVKYMNFNGIINSIRSIFYYFYMGTNGISRLLIHTSLILLLIVIPIILNIKKKPEFKDEANSEDDTVDSDKILNYEERKQLSKTLTLFTMFIWLFTSIIATKF